MNGNEYELLWKEEFENSDTNSVTRLLDSVFEGLVVVELHKSVGLINLSGLYECAPGLWTTNKPTHSNFICELFQVGLSSSRNMKFFFKPRDCI
jgi:hypothetical protein